MEDYGPAGTLWVSPDGEVWRYQRKNVSYTRNGEGETLWDQPFTTYYFEVWGNRPSRIQNLVNQRGVFSLPHGSIRVWTPTT